MFFLTYSRKTGKCWNLNTFTESRPGKNPDSAIVIVFFPERGEEIEPWFWHIWIAQWRMFLRKNVVILATKSANFGSSSFPQKLESFKTFSDNVFVCQSITSGETFDRIGPYTTWKGAKTPLKGRFHGCWIGTQNFESF